MAQQFSQLCTLLVEDTYGELCAQVFKTLSAWGRLSLPTLVQHCQLSPRHVRHGLAVLIQYHLVFHSAAEPNAPAFYDVDWNGAYNIMRSGKIVQIVEDRFGQGAGQLTSNLLQFGHARVGDLEDAYKFDSKNSGAVDSVAEHVNGEDSINGVHKPQNKKITSRAQLHTVLYQLLKSGFLVRVQRRTYFNAADASNEAEVVVKREQFPDGKVTGPKASALFNKAVNELKRKWRDEADNTTAGVKRGASSMNGHGPSAKRMKTNGGMANGVGRYGDDDDEGVYLERDMVIKVNYEKCNVALRSQTLERLAARSIGESTAKVYGALLQLLERKIPRCYDDLDEYVDEQEEEAAQPSATTLDIGDLVPASLDLTTTIAKEDDFLNGDDVYDDDDDDRPVAPVKREASATNGYGNDASSFADRNKRLTQIEQHMALLAEHPRNFCTKISTRGKGEWRVNFPALARWMQRNEAESLISARFGSIATRIVRMLNAKGKLDEKQVANYTLMRQKDIRAILAEMHEAGFLEAQEVPKDNTRQPSRTLFLWYFDLDRCRRLLLSATYKAQARLIQRMQFEKEEVSAVVQKAERLDVVGHEDQFLTSSDKAILNRWSEFEQKLIVQMARQDELVALMRDFLGEQKLP